MSVDKLRNVFADRINAVVKEAKVNHDSYNPKTLQEFSSKITTAIDTMKALSSARIKKREEDYAKRSVFTKLFYYAYYAIYNRKENNAINQFVNKYSKTVENLDISIRMQENFDKLKSHQFFSEAHRKQFVQNNNNNEIGKAAIEDINKLISTRGRNSIAEFKPRIPIPSGYNFKQVFWKDFIRSLIQSYNPPHGDLNNKNLKKELAHKKNESIEKETAKFHDAYHRIKAEVGEKNMEAFTSYTNQDGFAFLMEKGLDYFNHISLPFVLKEDENEKSISVITTDTEVKTYFKLTCKVCSLENAEEDFALVSFERCVVLNKQTGLITSVTDSASPFQEILHSLKN